LKPSDDNTTALDTLLDQVAAWSTALAPLARRVPGCRLNSRKPVPGVVKPLCDRWRTAGNA
jgi:hypothetical protein